MPARLAIAVLLVALMGLPGCANSKVATDSLWQSFRGLNSDVDRGGAWGPTDRDWKEPIGGR